MRCAPSISALLLVVVLSSCGDDDAPSDGGAVDAPSDARPRDAARDAGPVCASACGSATQLCCPETPGSADGVCVNPIEDPNHCGDCGIECAAGASECPTCRRGTRCALSRCECGDVMMGCAGTRESTCCPPRVDGGIAYCANLFSDGDDCGACNASCEALQADRCDGARCLCGDGRRACEGTAEDSCCRDLTGASACVDTRSARRHCGGCGVRCEDGETCVDSTCVVGSGACPGGCPSGQVCCRGVCCERVSCDLRTCAADGGT